MLFNSSVFVLFFLIVFLLYWFVTNKNLKAQNILLLISSYIFYGWWDWRFLSLIIFSSILDYYVSILIENETNQKKRKAFLLISMFSNLGLLGFFKYFNFFTSSFAQAMSTIGWEVDTVTLNIILPVGISFYTFQTMSYTIDVYRKEINASKDIIAFFTYVSFFPQLVAGPIERASNLLPQVERKRVFNEKWFNQGVLQVSVGFFRKMVIADNLGVYVDTVYANPDYYNSSTLLIATLFYAFQIYFDFSGYSDIAIGSAKMLGFKFNRNFNLPYFSKSVTEFWRRWHMSLSFWLRDYLYISLGGNRKGIKIMYRNLMLTMLLGGLWHGSSWNFVIWGGIHGTVLCLEKFTFEKLQIKNLGVFGMIYTFIIVLIAWVFFRATDFESSIFIIKELFSFNYGMPFIGDINVLFNAISMLIIGIGIDIYLFKSNHTLEDIGGFIKKPILIVSVSVLVMLIILFYSTTNNFIYFQF
ncbi:MAG TPA: MBOAT family O-acyltransferase [Candidatus Paceibacterota bacterium]|nr:MBOAT family O-acyltransferase [Candidatus Paceibacterota bacterium]